MHTKIDLDLVKALFIAIIGYGIIIALISTNDSNKNEKRSTL